MSTITARQRGFGNDGALIAAFLGVGVLYWIFIAARAQDGMMALHAYTFIAAFLAGLFALIVRATKPAPEDESGYVTSVVKAGVFASVFWGIAGFLVGVVIAFQLAFPDLFYFDNAPWTNFGRLRPLHTSAVIFAFGGNVLIATSFYVVQRTCKARLAGTSQLMVDFYENKVTKQKSLASSIREAKLKMIGDNTYSSPYYWAPFVLIGR